MSECVIGYGKVAVNLRKFSEGEFGNNLDALIQLRSCLALFSVELGVQIEIPTRSVSTVDFQESNVIRYIIVPAWDDLHGTRF